MYTIDHSASTGLARTDPMLPQWFEVRRYIRETHDTFTLEIAEREHDTNFRFAPGQFNMLYVYGVGEVPISISGDPGRTDRLVHTIRAAGVVTRALARLKRGDVLGVRGPYGNPWPVDVARRHDLIILTGGIGLAPLRPVLYHVLRHRKDFNRVVLLYGARTPDDLLYADEFLNHPIADLDVVVTVDRAATGWKGRIGVVTTLIPRMEVDPARAIAFACGPEIMMRFAVKSLGDFGVTKDRVFISMERNMKCAVGFCGHCQYGPAFICKDGPVFRFDSVESIFGIREV